MDKDGEEHFTNDPAAIPPGQKTTTTEGAELGIISIDRSETAARAPEPAKQEARRRDSRRDAEPTPELDEAAREQAWRQRFREAKSHVSEAEALVAQDQKRYEQLKDVSYQELSTHTGHEVSHPATSAKDQLDRDKAALKQAQEDLSDLDRAASRQAIPRAWRE